MTDKAKQWCGRPVLSDTDLDHLERGAALYEFRDGLSRQDAEAKSYEDYAQEHGHAAAAHHLLGMRAAQATGDLKTAALHGSAYHLHMTALGYDPLDAVPSKVSALVEAEGREPHLKFKGHKADALVGQD